MSDLQVRSLSFSAECFYGGGQFVVCGISVIIRIPCIRYIIPAKDEKSQISLEVKSVDDVSNFVNNCCTSLICNLLSEKTFAEQIQERG